MSFKDNYKDVQHLVREVTILRGHNISGKKDNEYLLFSEAAVTCILLERFLRIIPIMSSTAEQKLSHLLRTALLSKKIGFLTITDAEKVIAITCGIRNGLLHGNFEQLYDRYNVSSLDYFKSHFEKDIDTVYDLVDKLFMNIDSTTGTPIRFMNNCVPEIIGMMVRLTDITVNGNFLIDPFLVMLPTRPEQFAPSDPDNTNPKIERYKDINYFQSLLDSPTKERDIMAIGHLVAKQAIEHQANVEGKIINGNVSYEMEVKIYLPK